MTSAVRRRLVRWSALSALCAACLAGVLASSSKPKHGCARAADAVAPPALASGDPQLGLDPTAPSPAPGSDRVVARVGDSVVTAGELALRLAEIPPREREMYGSTPEEIRKNYLERVVLRDVIRAEEARARGLDKQRDVRDRELGILRAMLVHDQKKEAKVDQISAEDVKKYFDANPDKFTSPKRIMMMRILVATEGEATAILAELGDKPDPKRWNDLARQKSLDKATYQNGGSLGTVAEDGTTGKAEARVDPALFKAADAVADGTLVPKPVKEGQRWAVIWKRQTMQPVTRSLDAESPAIRAEMADQRTRDAMQALLERLRAENVKELNLELCDMVTVTGTGELERQKRPGTLPRTKRGADPTPAKGPGVQR